MLRGLLGVGSRSENLIIGTLRLPRIEAALLAGAAFGLAGAVFQAVLRNPLASPDILGVSSGASLGAVVAVLVFGWSGFSVSASAFIGALGVAVLIWALAWRQGLHGLRFVLVGVGLAYLSGSTISWLLSQADVREAQPVLLWTVGSVADVRGASLGALAVLVAVFGAWSRWRHARCACFRSATSWPRASAWHPTRRAPSCCSPPSGSSRPPPVSPARSRSSRCWPRRSPGG
ncbi:iron ABC transporter permease [Tessaracoccus sp. HDW20]|nr:iron chelate uptake ABC transporter family permease subunit [Tessaracoccus coleopterorum]NHB85285.1 iron ABC transporter permease [Tessaracoccus coleopterorum]